MSYKTYIFFAFILLLLLASFRKLELRKKMYYLIGASIILLIIGTIILPRNIPGKWNSISNFNNKNIEKILLFPSEPNWKVNLNGQTQTISDRNQITKLVELLENVNIYFPNHPTRIWETKMQIISTEHDTLEMEVQRTDNNGTVIYSKTNEWRKDELGNYLEEIVTYKNPLYSDTSKTKL